MQFSVAFSLWMLWTKAIKWEELRDFFPLTDSAFEV